MHQRRGAQRFRRISCGSRGGHSTYTLRFTIKSKRSRYYESSSAKNATSRRRSSCFCVCQSRTNCMRLRASGFVRIWLRFGFMEGQSTEIPVGSGRPKMPSLTGSTAEAGSGQFTSRSFGLRFGCVVPGHDGPTDPTLQKCKDVYFFGISFMVFNICSNPLLWKGSVEKEMERRK